MSYHIIQFNDLKEEKQTQILGEKAKELFEAKYDDLKREWIETTREHPDDRDLQNFIYELAQNICDKAWTELEID